MKAYAILDGGGVKGAALAGCLQAAHEVNVSFVGYGGTSAGALVAYLAALGYSPNEMRDLIVETDVLNFVGGDAAELNRVLALKDMTSSMLRFAMCAFARRDTFRKLSSSLGLYDGQSLKAFLLGNGKKKLGNAFSDASDISFEELRVANLPALKVVTTDLQLRAPVVYSAAGGHERNGSVIDAVRASMSYPFVFEPVRMSDRFLVDGGLSTNLPLFLFEKERRTNGLPVVAFDLVSMRGSVPKRYGIDHFLSDMVETALDSGDLIQRQLLSDIYHVKVPIPAEYRTLDFALSRKQREELFTIGHSCAHSYFSKLSHWRQASGIVEALQAQHVPPNLVTRVLEAVARTVQESSDALGVRAHIMLPTARGTRIVVYHYGMGGHPDHDLELDLYGGCSGRAMFTRSPSVADLMGARTTFSSDWKMNASQQAKVWPEAKAMCSVPIFDTSNRLAQSVADLDVIGVLSVDSIVALDRTGWIEGSRLSKQVADAMLAWADIISEILR